MGDMKKAQGFCSKLYSGFGMTSRVPSPKLGALNSDPKTQTPELCPRSWEKPSSCRAFATPQGPRPMFQGTSGLWGRGGGWGGLILHPFIWRPYWVCIAFCNVAMTSRETRTTAKHRLFGLRQESLHIHFQLAKCIGELWMIPPKPVDYLNWLTT